MRARRGRGRPGALGGAPALLAAQGRVSQPQGRGEAGSRGLEGARAARRAANAPWAARAASCAACACWSGVGSVVAGPDRASAGAAGVVARSGAACEGERWVSGTVGRVPGRGAGPSRGRAPGGASMAVQGAEARAPGSAGGPSAARRGPKDSSSCEGSPPPLLTVSSPSAAEIAALSSAPRRGEAASRAAFGGANGPLRAPSEAPPSGSGAARSARGAAIGTAGEAAPRSAGVGAPGAADAWTLLVTSNRTAPPPGSGSGRTVVISPAGARSSTERGRGDQSAPASGRSQGWR